MAYFDLKLLFEFVVKIEKSTVLVQQLSLRNS